MALLKCQFGGKRLCKQQPVPPDALKLGYNRTVSVCAAPSLQSGPVNPALYQLEPYWASCPVSCLNIYHICWLLSSCGVSAALHNQGEFGYFQWQYFFSANHMLRTLPLLADMLQMCWDMSNALRTKSLSSLNSALLISHISRAIGRVLWIWESWEKMSTMNNWQVINGGSSTRSSAGRTGPSHLLFSQPESQTDQQPFPHHN